MGTIVLRKRKNGSTAFMAKIVISRQGKIVHRETQTFERRAVAAAWIAKREDELSKPGAIERAKNARVTLADAVERYEREQTKKINPTKQGVLEKIKAHDIGAMACEDINSQHIVSFAQDFLPGRKPQTVRTYVAYLSTIFSVAGPAWGYPLDRNAMDAAKLVTERLGVIKQSQRRDRRPTLDELAAILTHTMRPNGNMTIPMTHIIAFAIFSTRRREEITRIRWSDLDEAHSRILVRDMKDPREKIGNDTWCNLPPEALRVIQAMPKLDERIFPHNPSSISNAFADTCAAVEVEGLRFHDLRHEGISRLFETGLDIPRVAAVSGHRSWESLKRYTHIRQTGDKYAGWKWLDVVTKPPPQRRLSRVLCSGEPSQRAPRPRQSPGQRSAGRSS